MVLIRQPNSDAPSDRYIFQARCTNVRELHAVLKAVAFRETATISISSNGLRVIVEELKCLQANAFLQSELFDEFVIREDTINFCLNISVLCECLNLFGGGGQSSGANAKFLYAGYGTPLKLLIEDGGIMTDCAIKTIEPSALLDFDFSPSNVISKIIMKPDVLRDAFHELDNSTELVEISVDPEHGFQISAADPYCSAVTEIPKESEVIDSFSCLQAQSFNSSAKFTQPKANLLFNSIRIYFCILQSKIYMVDKACKHIKEFASMRGNILFYCGTIPSLLLGMAKL